MPEAKLQFMLKCLFVVLYERTWPVKMSHLHGIRRRRFALTLVKEMLKQRLYSFMRATWKYFSHIRRNVAEMNDCSSLLFDHLQECCVKVYMCFLLSSTCTKQCCQTMKDAQKGFAGCMV